MSFLEFLGKLIRLPQHAWQLVVASDVKYLTIKLFSLIKFLSSSLLIFPFFRLCCCQSSSHPTTRNFKNNLHALLFIRFSSFEGNKNILIKFARSFEKQCLKFLSNFTRWSFFVASSSAVDSAVGVRRKVKNCLWIKREAPSKTRALIRLV